MSNRSINLDFSKTPVAPVIIYGRVGDNGLQTITVHLSNFNEPMDLRDGVLAFEGLISDGQKKIIDSEGITADPEKLIEGTFEYTFPSAAFSMEGIYKRAYFSFQKEGKRNTTGDFKIIVLGNTDIDVEEAESIITEYNKLIDQLNELYTQTTEKVTGEYEQFHQQVTESVTEINELINNTKIDLQGLKDKVAELKHIVENLENLSVVYSDSINFGNYDYSGNPNIAPLINDNNVMSLLNTVTKVTPKGTYATAEKIADGDLSVGVGMIPWSRYDFTQLTVGKQYTLTIPIRINEDYTGDISKLYIRLRCSNEDGGVLVSTKLIPTNTSKAEFVNISTTFTVPSTAKKSNNWYCQVGSYGDSVDTRGTVDIGYEVKLEEGSTATPYQPNLLDAPYYLSKTLLGENIADPAVQFPIKTSAYNVYQKDMKEPFTAGQTYTLTIKATKASTQTFMVYNEGIGDFYYGNLKTIEGISDMWLLTFTPQKVSATFPKRLTIIQYPQSTLGACQIDWLKIEKGDTRTPNIQQYKYFGTGIKDSDDPNDFVWDLTPEYIEANFAKETDVKTNTNNIKMLIDDLRVVTANVAWMKNNTYVLGKWQDLPLAGGYQGGDGTSPKYRIDTIDGHKKLSFSGAVTTTNNTLPSQSQQHAISTLPKELIPSDTKMGIGPTSSLSTSCRIAVTSAGNLYVGNDSGKDVKYCYLDTFSYWLD